MPYRKPSKKVLRSLCARVEPGDGLDPKLEARARLSRSESTGTGRKVRQLCRQVVEAVDLALFGQSHDPVLHGLHVVSVVPAPDASRLLVTVAIRPGEPFEPDRILGHLERASAWLRCEVAAAITRKRAPALAFRVAIPEMLE